MKRCCLFVLLLAGCRVEESPSQRTATSINAVDGGYGETPHCFPAPGVMIPISGGPGIRCGYKDSYPALLFPAERQACIGMIVSSKRSEIRISWYSVSADSGNVAWRATRLDDNGTTMDYMDIGNPSGAYLKTITSLTVEPGTSGKVLVCRDGDKHSDTLPVPANVIGFTVIE